MVVVRVRIVVAIVVLLHVVSVGGWRRHRHVVVVVRRIIGRVLQANLVADLQRHIGQALLLLLVMRWLGHYALRLGHHRGQQLLSVLQQLKMRRRGRGRRPNGHLLWHLLVFHSELIVNLGRPSYHNRI